MSTKEIVGIKKLNTVWVKHKETDNQLNVWKHAKEAADLDQNNVQKQHLMFSNANRFNFNVGFDSCLLVYCKISVTIQNC